MQSAFQLPQANLPSYLRASVSDALYDSHLILLGDLNYRVTLANDKVRSLVTQNDFKTLLEHDQVSPRTSAVSLFFMRLIRRTLLAHSSRR